MKRLIPESFKNYSLQMFFNLVDSFISSNLNIISDKEKNRWNRYGYYSDNHEVPFVFVNLLRYKGFKIKPSRDGTYPFDILLCELKTQTSNEESFKISSNQTTHPLSQIQ